MAKENRNDKFEIDGEGVEFMTPSCKNCKYAIDNGVNGCEEDWQTLEIKFGYDQCEYREAKE